jgi:hypothetical protein
MGFFRSLFGSSNRGKVPRYVSEAAFRQNLAKQIGMAPLTVAQLRKHGVTDLSMLKLEFFFYTNIESKAQELVASLKQINYEVHAGPSASDRRVFLVTGWTTPMRMDEEGVTGWSKQMCLLGFRNDCEFDGWGTNPTQ